MGVEGIELLKPETADPDLEPPKVAHIVGPIYNDDGTKIPARARILEAMVNGTPIEALCGFTWVPVYKPQQGHPVCQACKNIFERSGESE